MPNGAQEQIEEEEGSGGESQEEWQSDGEEDEIDPPRTERRYKLSHGPTVERGKETTSVGQSSKRPRTASPAPTEKAPKHPRAASSKPSKALPKMRMAIPMISG